MTTHISERMDEIDEFLSLLEMAWKRRPYERFFGLLHRIFSVAAPDSLAWLFRSDKENMEIISGWMDEND